MVIYKRVHSTVKINWNHYLPAIKKKIVNIHALKELSSDPLMNNDGVGLIEDDTSLSLPMFIPEYDMTINGLRYYRP